MGGYHVSDKRIVLMSLPNETNVILILLLLYYCVFDVSFSEVNGRLAQYIQYWSNLAMSIAESPNMDSPDQIKCII